MDPIVIAVIALVVVALVVFIAMRGSGKKSLTSAQPPKQPPLTKEPSRSEKEPPAAEPLADASAADEASGTTPETEEAQVEAGEQAPPEPIEAAPVVEVSETVAVEAAPPAGPTEEDVAALKKGLKSTRGGFIARLAKIFGQKREIDPDLLDEVEEVLITADIGVKTADKILTRLRGQLERDELADSDRVWEEIRQAAREILAPSKGTLKVDNKPTVILVVGVNGVGKTTTIGKLASRLKDEGKSVMLAAGDTFRAAAVLQLEVWGRRVGCPVVKGKDRADPGSVIFDAVKTAEAEGVDVVIADTAGRLHTKVPLMDELTKVNRTVEKALNGRPADEVLLVLDSTNGQNAIQQAQLFREALDVTGIVLTKLDGTAKGGVILGIVDEHQIPVRFIGIGERVEDLREFDAPSFVEALFEKPDESIAA